MTDESIGDGGAWLPQWTPPPIERGQARPARIYDYLLGGKDNFEVDREAAEVALDLMPELRAMARVNRAFLGRAVRHLAEAGITQFLDIGSGIPGPGNTGEVARRVHPEARVVYVDYDPIVCAHSRALLVGADPDRTAILQADVREPKTILDSGAVHAVLDFDQPIAVLMVAVLDFVSDVEDAHGIAIQFLDALAPGSGLALSHASEGREPGKFGAARKGWNNATSQLVLRDRQEVGRFFTGTELLAPGVVIIPAWRPDHELTDAERDLDYGYAGVGIKR
ncbi:SAM-dependent methyltransferase [Catenulispora pinisilvae]|uniref:SAM-dependent methyltransferase n=1 Tax=Catenulispora pinisilvae TaxID=2705253 RepID=UPI0018914E78|nr:SAM-dependent methyltransferase [Catenulispora pinisilvae]